MLKPYEEMRKIDVRPYCEDREGKLYLNWAKCIELLHENGAEKVYWVPVPDPKTGSSLRMTDIVFTDKSNNTNRCYETLIEVVIDDNVYRMQSPVMNGSNPVKDNSMSQQRVWNSMCRSFVKCVAIHTGLGFNLWLKEEFNKFENAIPTTDADRATPAQIKQIKLAGDNHPNLKLDDWLALNNVTWDALILRKVGNTLHDSVYAQMKWAIQKMGLEDEFIYKVSPLEIIYKPTGQKIFFRGADDPLKIKSIKPEFGYIGIIWFEELDQFAGPEEIRSIEQSAIRGGDVAYKFKSFNPPKSKNNWANEYVAETERENPDAVVYRSTYKDVPPEWLGQKFIDDAEHLRKINPEAYENEYDGVANGSGGNVFEYLEIREITDDEINRMDRIYQGVDWGWYPDKYAFIRSYYDRHQEKIYLIDENYVNKTPNKKTAEWIIKHGYDDYLITCDSNENKSVNDYRDMGILARAAIKGPGSVEYGFKWLQGKTIVIDRRRTPNAYNEITKYEYARDKDGNVMSGYPEGQEDHIIAALRYAYEDFFNRRGNSA